MKRSNLTAVVVSMVMAAGLLNGCGGKEQQSTSSVSETETMSSTTPESEKSTDRTVVKLWAMTFNKPDRQAALLEVFAQSELSKSIELKLSEIPEGGSQEVGDALLTNLIGDSGIDIFDANLVEYVNYSTKGMLENLEPYAKADGYDFDQLGKDNVTMSRIKGDLYALPYIQSTWLLYYNKDLFDQAGVAYPTDDMTWDEFREKAKMLTKGEGADKQWGFTMPDWVCTWAGIATQQGINFIKEDGTSNLDNPAFKDALKFKYDLTMVDKSGPSLAENKVTKAHYSKQFSAGNVAMMIAGDWSHLLIRENLGGNFTFQYDVAAMPHPEGVAAGTTYGAPRYLGMNAKRSEEQKKAAWEVLKFMAGPEVAEILVTKAGTVPAVVTEEAQKAYTDNLPEFVKNGAVIFKPHKHVEEKSFHIASNQIDKAMDEESQMYLSGNQSLEQTMENMIKRSNEEIRTANEAAE